MVKAKKVSKTKKVVSKSTRKPEVVVSTTTPVMEPVETNLPENKKFRAPVMNQRFLRIALIVVLAGLATYKFGPWLFPAFVNNRPVSRFELYSRMEKAYGTQTLDDTVNEKVLDEAIAKNGVKVDRSKVDEQMKNLEKQFESVGGLDEALKQRGLTRAELEKQVVTQLSVEEILKDKIEPKEEEIKADFDSNKDTLYKDKKYDDVKEEIKTRLKDTKLREAFLEWFAEVKKDIPVKNFGL